MDQKSKVIQLEPCRVGRILTNIFGPNRYSPMAERVARQFERDLVRTRISVKADSQKANPLSTLETHLYNLEMGAETSDSKGLVLGCLGSIGSVDGKSREVLTNILELEKDSDIRAAVANLLNK